MKYLTSFILALGLVFGAVTTSVAAETQKVCVDKLGKDGQPVKGKDGKAVQSCKEMKVHKKLEGTPVPEKKK